MERVQVNLGYFFVIEAQMRVALHGISKSIKGITASFKR